jgi:DNA-binding MarR family transcriptional regulator/N-acetylglutamate synthase-like GNAT family acetyltransferase
MIPVQDGNHMKTLDARVDAVRRFSRFYTKRIGILAEGILESEYSLTEARVLYELAHAGDRHPSELAAGLELDPGYVSRVLKRFERRGLLVRTPSEADRRRIVAALTPHGQEAYEALVAGSRKQTETLLAGLSVAGQKRVVEAMRSIECELGTEPALPRVTYRGHRPGDLGWIVERHAVLYHASHGWDDTFEAMVAGIAQEFLERFDPACERSWIAEVDGQRAGAIALVRKSKTVGQLRLLFVEPWARGLGIGARLVSECVGQARHVGYRRMILFTVAGLDAARRLYEAEGFTLAEEAPAHLWGKDEVEQRWELKL